jgi:hypothetical protein
VQRVKESTSHENQLKIPPSLHSIFINNKEIVVSYAKTLGLTVSNDFKWKMHNDNIISKASKRLHLITQLKRAQVPVKDLIQIYCACIRSTLEYALLVYYNSLPQ